MSLASPRSSSGRPGSRCWASCWPATTPSSRHLPSKVWTILWCFSIGLLKLAAFGNLASTFLPIMFTLNLVHLKLHSLEWKISGVSPPPGACLWPHHWDAQHLVGFEPTTSCDMAHSKCATTTALVWQIVHSSFSSKLVTPREKSRYYFSLF